MTRFPFVAVMVCTIFVFSLVLIPFANADWIMFRSDPFHSGVGTGNPVITPTSLWNFTFAHGYSSPAVANGVVYTGSLDGNVYALKASTGIKLWSHGIGNGVFSSPAVVNGVVYVGSENGIIYALNTAKGTQVWSYNAGGIIDSSPAVVDSTVYIGSTNGNLYALNATNGSKLWSTHIGSSVLSSSAVANGVVYVGSMKVYSSTIDTANGIYALNTLKTVPFFGITLLAMESIPLQQLSTV